MTIENMVLPTKFAPLSQLGIDVVTNWARANSDLARETATMVRENPRAMIERFFRLTSDQQLGLAKVSDWHLQQLVEPLARHWSQGSFPRLEIEFELETVAVPSDPTAGLDPVGGIVPRPVAGGFQGPMFGQTLLQTAGLGPVGGIVPRPVAGGFQGPMFGQTLLQRCKRIIGKIVDAAEGVVAGGKKVLEIIDIIF